jgi:hypothetical protein
LTELVLVTLELPAAVSDVALRSSQEDVLSDTSSKERSMEFAFLGFSPVITLSSWCMSVTAGTFMLLLVTQGTCAQPTPSICESEEAFECVPSLRVMFDDATVEENLGMVPVFCTEYLSLTFFTIWPRDKPSTSVSSIIPLFFLTKSADFLFSSPLTVFAFAHAVCLESYLSTIDTSLGTSLPATYFVTFI